jgi:hypothetical protein
MAEVNGDSHLSFLQNLADEVSTARNTCLELCDEVERILKQAGDDGKHSKYYTSISQVVTKKRAEAACLLAKSFLRENGSDLDLKSRSETAKEEVLYGAKSSFLSASVHSIKIIVKHKTSVLEGTKAGNAGVIPNDDLEKIVFPPDYTAALEKLDSMLEDACSSDGIPDNVFERCHQAFKDFMGICEKHLSTVQDKIIDRQYQTETITIRKRRLYIAVLAIIVTAISVIIGSLSLYFKGTLGETLFGDVDKPKVERSASD